MYRGLRYRFYLCRQALVGGDGHGTRLAMESALIITVLSYDGTISISPTTGANIMPDIDQFVDMLRQATDELEAAVFETVPHRRMNRKWPFLEAIVSDSAESDAQRCTVPDAVR